MSEVKGDASKDSRSTERLLGLADGLEVVRVSDGLVLATATAVLRLEGGVASAVADVILPRLDSPSPKGKILDEFPATAQDEVGHVIDRLVSSGLLAELPAPGEVEPPPWTSIISGSLSVRQGLARRLAATRVTVLGRGAGVPETLTGLVEAGVGRVRAAELAADGHDRGAAVERITCDLSPQGVEEVVSGNDLVIVVVPPALSAVRVWTNAAGLAADVPTLHAVVDGPVAHVGPLVLPGEGPCYLCWRMRAVACEDDFELAMAREEALDAARSFGATDRPVLPSLPPSIAAAIVHDVLALTVAVSQPRLAGHVLRIRPLDDELELHPVLPRADCPACSKKGRPPTVALSLDDLCDLPPRETDFDTIALRAVSPLCGLIRKLDRIPKDVLEPELPVIVRAETANARFLRGEDGFIGCSGKGGDVETARNLALGEAMERHASLTWQPPQTKRARRADLDGSSLAPEELVLFAPEQYADLPYAPYHDDLELDWVPSRSLVTGREVWVPLLATHLAYEPPTPDARLFPASSNGFAALSAILEVVERDAFLLAWAHRLATPRYDATAVPDDVTRSLALAYARRGVRIDVHLLPTDSDAFVAMAVGWSDEQPAAVVGLGAAMDAVSAARRAVLEVGQVRPALRARLRRPEVLARLGQLVEDPQRVSTLEDHDLLYADAATAEAALAHLLAHPVEEWPTAVTSPGSPREELRDLVGSLAAVAGDVLYVDVSSPEAESLGIHVVRAIVPGFQPIHFGAKEFRLGHERLARVPFDLGLIATPVRIDELNKSPHPMA